MRSSTGTKVGLDLSVVDLTNSTIAVLAGPSFHAASSSARTSSVVNRSTPDNRNNLRFIVFSSRLGFRQPRSDGMLHRHDDIPSPSRRRRPCSVRESHLLTSLWFSAQCALDGREQRIVRERLAQ